MKLQVFLAIFPDKHLFSFFAFSCSFKISGHTLYTACWKIEALPSCLLSEMGLSLLDKFLQYSFLFKNAEILCIFSLAPSSKLALNIYLIKPKLNSKGFR